MRYHLATGRIISFNTVPDTALVDDKGAPEGEANLEIAADHALAQAKDSSLCMVIDGALVARLPDPIVVDEFMVKAEAKQRIIIRYPLGKQNTIMLRGGAERDEMHDFIEAIIAASHRIESMRPIPPDFTADRYWN